jgi:hypothetical protein
MADAGEDHQFVDGLRLRNQALEVENSNLRDVVRRLNGQIAICMEKYGPNCFVKRPKPVVSISILPFMGILLVGFNFTSWAPF